MRILWVVLLLAGLAAAQQPPPKCLLEGAKKDLPKDEDSSNTIALLKSAVAQFENTAQEDPAHAEALELLAMYLHWTYSTNLEAWKTEVQGGVQQALAICEAQPKIDPDTLALALELEADVLGRSEAGLPFWARAQRIRATRVAAVEPEEKQTLTLPLPGVRNDVVGPALKTMVEPVYPLPAKHAGLECARALLSIVIDANGVPGQFRLLKGCGYGFDEQGVDAVKRWRFIPASLNGLPVATPANVEVNFRLSSGDIDAERSSALKAEEQRVKRTRDLAKLGQEALVRREYQKAEKDFEEATILDPEGNYAWNGLGSAYLSLGQIDKAESAFKRQTEINAADPWAYNNLGRALVSKGDIPGAIEAYRKQIYITPDDKFAHLNLARALEAQGKWDQALPEAQKASELTPGNGAAWMALGRAQARSGKLEEARKNLNKVLDLNDSTNTQNSVAYEMAETGIDLERAWQLASSAVAVASGQVCSPEGAVADRQCDLKLSHLAAFLDTAGWVLFKQGKTNEAQPFLESTYGIAPHSAITLHLAALYAKQNKLDAAVWLYGIARLSPVLEQEENNAVKAQLEERLDNHLSARLEALPKNELVEGSVAPPLSWRTDGLTTPIRLSALVDSGGNIIETKPEGTAVLTPAQRSEIQKLKLLPLAWPGHALKSVRTIEVRLVDSTYRVVSYVGPPLRESHPEETSSAEGLH